MTKLICTSAVHVLSAMCCAAERTGDDKAELYFRKDELPLRAPRCLRDGGHDVLQERARLRRPFLQVRGRGDTVRKQQQLQEQLTQDLVLGNGNPTDKRRLQEGALLGGGHADVGAV